MSDVENNAAARIAAMAPDGVRGIVHCLLSLGAWWSPDRRRDANREVVVEAIVKILGSPAGDISYEDVLRVVGALARLHRVNVRLDPLAAEIIHYMIVAALDQFKGRRQVSPGDVDLSHPLARELPDLRWGIFGKRALIELMADEGIGNDRGLVNTVLEAIEDTWFESGPKPSSYRV